VLLADADGWLGEVLDIEAHNDLAETSLQGVLSFARYVPQLAEPDAPLRLAVRRALAHHRGDVALELGCSIGADVRALRDVAASVVALDVWLPVLRLARAQLDGQPIPWPRRIEGRSFQLDEPRSFPAVSDVTLVVGDAQDIPLHDASVDIVLALNVIDNVPSPRMVLDELERVLRPGGLLVLGSPFAWQEAITPVEEQLGGVPGHQHLDTPSVLPELLSGYDILTREDVPWVLPDHTRASFHYLVHLVAARKR